MRMNRWLTWFSGVFLGAVMALGACHAAPTMPPTASILSAPTVAATANATANATATAGASATATATFTPTAELLRDFPSAALGNTRALIIYLPPDYAVSAAHYPVLYVLDGQDLNRLGMRQTLARLYAEQAITPLIVVGIPAENRLQEYGMATAPGPAGLGARAALHARFVLEEVMPAINARYRTLAGPAHTTILGSSLGGLTAFDLAWRHPDVFGAVGVFSGSFWWRDEATQTRQVPLMVHNAATAPALRVWLQAGTLDETSDRDRNGVIDAIQDTLDVLDALRARGLPETDLAYVQVEGGRHDQVTWARALPDFLRWRYAP